MPALKYALIKLRRIYRIKKSDASKLEDEYKKLVEGLRGGMGDGAGADGEDGENDDFMANPGELKCSAKEVETCLADSICR